MKRLGRDTRSVHGTAGSRDAAGATLGRARMLQEANGLQIEPLATEVVELEQPDIALDGGPDDIGDIMWTVATITIRFPSNVPKTMGHNITAAMAMATHIAHKGAMSGAEAVALTTLDLLTTRTLVADA